MADALSATTPRPLLLLTVLLVISACAPARPAPTVVSFTLPAVAPQPTVAVIAPDPPPPPPPPPSGAIVPDAGLEELPVGKTTRKDFEARLGAPQSVVKHGIYSTELQFAQGIAAFYCQGDDAETIFAEHFRPPFEGHVEHAGQTIVMGETTAAQARAILGEKTPWRTTDKNPTWWLEWDEPDDRELHLHVARDLSVPQFPLDEARHLGRPIVEISVSVSSVVCDRTYRQMMKAP
jgi:hypothetical protein